MLDQHIIHNIIIMGKIVHVILMLIVMMMMMVMMSMMMMIMVVVMSMMVVVVKMRTQDCVFSWHCREWGKNI